MSRACSAQSGLLESAWQAQVIELARLGCWTHIFHAPHGGRGGGRAGTHHITRGQIKEGKGFPDLILARDGELLARELKPDTGRLGDGQQGWLDALAAAGVDVGVWRPRDIDEVRERLLGRRGRS